MTEIEVKIRVEDFDEIEEKLAKHDILKITEWEFEDNIVFDFPDKRLKNGKKLFRLRDSAGKVYITFKTPSKDRDEKFKIREEYEVIVSDFEKSKTIIELLGLVKFFRYQKQRKTYILKGIHICLDKTPIGNFIELEGEKEIIIKMAKLFGKSEKDFITRSYYDVFREIHPEGDMIFQEK